ncbi:MAG: STAS domain-containing protein [Acidimicrobiales bacterium]|nr:STAS domain-containing protein [Acidimicrobiales bacterium]MCB9372227.1 STAS domain-containing protein [Microthrixaceae bacterium]
MTALLPRTEAPDFRITGAAVDDELVVTLAGEVDLSSRERISQFVALEVDACPGTLVIDLAAVTFVDSTGLSLLIRAHDTVTAHGGRVVVRHANAQFRRLLAITGVDRVVAVEP